MFNGLPGLRWSWRSREPKLDPATRHAAYRELWEKLDDIYWKLRNGDSDASALRALLRDVNAFLGENLLYIREADQELFTQYILSLQRLKAAVYPLLDNELPAWEATEGPTPARIVDINVVTQEAAELRNSVLQNVRQARPSH